MMSEITQMPLEIQGIFDSDPAKVYLCINASGHIIRTANRADAAAQSVVNARLSAIFEVLRTANADQLRSHIAPILARATYPEPSTSAVPQVASAAGIVQQVQAASTREQTVSPEQLRWERRIANIPTYLITSRDVANQQVTEDAEPGTLRFYPGTGQTIGRLLIKLSNTSAARIEVPNNVDVFRLYLHLTSHFREIPNSDFLEGILSNFLVSEPDSGSSSLIVANEIIAANALRNTGDFRFYTRLPAPGDTLNLKRIMIRLSFGNRKIQIQDHISFSDFQTGMQTIEGFLSRLFFITSRNEEDAQKSLGETETLGGPLRVILNASNRPTKFFLKHNDQLVTVEVPETITPRQLLNEVEKNYLLLTSGARDREEAIAKLRSAPSGTKIFYRSSTNPNEIRYIQKVSSSNLEFPASITHTIAPEQDFIETLARFSSAETQLQDLQTIRDLLDCHVEGAQKTISNLPTGKYALWIEGNQLRAMIRVPGLLQARPRIFTLPPASEMTPFKQIEFLEDPSNQFNILILAHLTTVTEADARSLLGQEPNGSYRVFKTATNSYILLLKTATGIQKIDVPSGRPLFEALDELISRA